MGICSSCEATAVVKSSNHTSHMLTSKIVLPNGKLQELERPLKVSDVLNEILYNGILDESHEQEEEEQKKKSSCSYFLCNPDEMELDGLVKAMEEDEELQPGQLYFLLPTSMLSKPLGAKEMAALAVRDTNALSALVINLQYSGSSSSSSSSSSAAAGQYYYDLCNTHSHNSSSRESNYDIDASAAAVTASVCTLDLAQQQQQGRRAGTSDHSRRRRVGSRGSFSSDLGSIPEE